MASVFSEDFSAFLGTGFAPSPAVGQLDSDVWRITGMSDGDGAFGGTHDTVDFARGADADGGVNTGGVYAFSQTGSGNVFLGLQPIGTDFTPGAITAAITNTTGAEVTSWDIAYDIIVNNDQARANSLNFSFSTDDVTYTAVAALDFTSAEAADALGFQTANRSTQISATVAAGGTLYLQWSGDDVSGSGSRDEFGIDNVTVDSVEPVITINEVDSDTAGADTLEFVELYDGGVGNTALDGYVVVLFNGSNDASYAAFDLDGYSTDANGFFVLGNAATTNVDLVFPDNTIQNGADAVAIYQGNSTDFPTGTAVTNTNLIDAIIYDTNDDDDTGLLTGLGQAIQYNEDENANKDFDSISADGTGTFVVQAPTPGASNTPPAGATVSINDVSIIEGDSGSINLEFTVTRTDNTGAFSVDFDTADGTATVADGDYDQVAGTVTFTAGGNLTETISVTVNGDTAIEPDEDFSVVLSNLVATIGSATISNATGIGTILTDDFTITAIHDVQGTGDTSPLAGQIVTVEAVVVGDFQNGDGDVTRNLQGFYLQEQDADVDADPMTSEGLFIFDGSTPAIDVNVGDVVRVTGTVSETFGQTQISATAVQVVSTGNPLPTATVITPSSQALNALEAYEGMLVSFGETMTITEMFNFDRFGEIRLNADGRVEQFTQSNLPSVAGYNAFLIELAASSITYDDGLDGSNLANPVLDGLDNFNTSNAVQMGDTIDNLSGVLSFGFSQWRVRSTQDGENTFADTNPREETPDNVGGDLKIASLNVLNFFSSLDDNPASGSPAITGPSGTLEPRGANSTAEYDRQIEKLVTAISGIDADVLGLVEIENDPAPGNAALEALVTALNAAHGAGTYAYIDTGPVLNVEGGAVTGDAIKVALLYKPGSVTPSGAFELLDSSDDPAFDSANMRPSLAQTFAENATGETFTAVVNHFKSKGSSAGNPDDADAGDGQGFSNGTRLAAAGALETWLATDPTGSGDTDFVILGDLNAYAMEDPVRELLDGVNDTAGDFDDLVNLAAQFSTGGPVYSYVFDGQIGTLDYAIASASFTGQVTGVTEWHINSDEADILDYNLDFGRDATIFDGAVPFRTSDHDPIIVGLTLDANVELYADATLALRIGRFGDFAAALAAAGNGEAIAINDAAAIGDAGANTIDVDNLTIFGDTPFDADLTLGAGVANLALVGSTGADVTGNGLDNTILGSDGVNTIFGGAGSDYLSGGGADDVLIGGDGNDTMIVDSASDDIVEVSGEGTADRVAAKVSFTLGADDDIELLTTTDTSKTDAIDLRGNTLAQIIAGNSGDNVLHDGGVGGVDTLSGGDGNDTYIVYNTGAIINEGTGRGTLDRVASGYDFTLASNQEIELLTTTNSTSTQNGIDLTGNNLAQTIVGNNGNNILSDGGIGGDDTLVGLDGNDTYIVKNIGAIIVEGVGQGTNDRVASAVSFTLAADDDIEHLRTTSIGGTNALNLTGNDISQTIIGNAGANAIDGKGAADILRGEGGTDTFLFSTALGGGNIDEIVDFLSGTDKIGLFSTIFSVLPGTITAANLVSAAGAAAADADDFLLFDTVTKALSYDDDGDGTNAAIQFATLTGVADIVAGDFDVFFPI